MNERINKLLDEAKLTPVQEMFESELYKFAELIVRECIEQCIGVEEDDDLMDDWMPDFEDGIRHGAGSCQTRIKRHFGVDE